MRALALDTTTRAGSLALVDADRIVEERAGDALRPHAERLPGEALALLADHGLAVADVNLFAIAAGPGSFTGLRIGIATIQGLAFTSARPVVAVSALEALAEAGSRDLLPGDFVGGWMDAHRRDVFSALYRVGAAETYEPERLIEVESPAVGDPIATIARWNLIVGDSGLTVIGDATPLYASTIDRGARPLRRAIGAPLLAGTIGLMAIARARHGRAMTAGDIQPLYVRRPDAEVARDAAGGDR
jgi:tRNA threonylcarbamoyladenosine biosynthesis protein TsaB